MRSGEHHRSADPGGQQQRVAIVRALGDLEQERSLLVPSCLR
jgi:ABC-type polar amino acid transport system ATPase subunit